jgi:hypothetical protein
MPILSESARKRAEPAEKSSADHAPVRLKEEIVARSEAPSWEEAKDEWDLVGVYFADPDEPGTCLCTHTPIIEHCVIRNRFNGCEAVVGNVCVTRFLGIDADAIFRSLRRIVEDPLNALSAVALGYVIGRNWLNPWEVQFYRDTYRRRKPSERVLAKRAEINRAILNHVRLEGLTHA